MRFTPVAIATVAVSACVSALGAAPPTTTAAAAGGTALWHRTLTAPAARTSTSGVAPASNRQGTNVDVSNRAGPQSETSIAIDPSNPQRIVAGSNDLADDPMLAYASADGGKSWSATQLPLPPATKAKGFDFGSDPGVAWDLHGNVYYSYIVVFFSSGGAVNGTEMAVARSSDGGSTWTATYFAPGSPGSFNDKPMIAVDTNPGSPYVGTIYVAWDIGGNGSTDLVVSRSTDGGRTFNAPVALNAGSGGYKTSSDPFVAPDGTVFVAWADEKTPQVMVRRSRDGGRTWDPAVAVAPLRVTDPYIPPQNLRGALVYPACGADRSTGAFRGELYCSWMDANPSGDTDILVSTSTDGGSSWSAPRVVNDDHGSAYQFNQWLAVDPVTGTAVISWNDPRNDPAGRATDIYLTTSTDGGRTWTANTRVTTATTDETASAADLDQYGDYEGLDVRGGIARPVWTDRRASTSPALAEEVFTAAVSTG